MASTLTGFRRSLLRWTDFGTPITKAPPAHAHAWAFTDTSYNRSLPSFEKVAGSSPTEFVMKDDLSLTIKFNSSPSFVLKKVFLESSTFQSDLLSHEQGHYEITSIICRDFFVDCMLLKGDTFSSQQEGVAAVNSINTASLDLLGKTHIRYDTDVHPEQEQGKSRGPKQIMWEGFFSVQNRRRGVLGRQIRAELSRTSNAFLIC